MESVTLLFWILLVLIFYPYLIYPGLLYLLARLRNQRIKAGEGKPSVTFIIPAYNEESVIGEKLQNTLMLDYPRQLLEILVVSDASTDRTDQIVSSYSEHGVQLLRNEDRKGKTYGLNKACSRATGDVLLFTDADSMFEKEMLNLLVRNFTDEKVGLVTGSTRYLSKSPDGAVVAAMGKYTLFEKWIKEQESLVGSCVGADGAIFALRKDLYVPLDHKDINDFVIPLHVVMQGRRAVLDKDVYCLEEHVDDEQNEYLRQVRITNRTIRAMINYRQMLNPFRHGLYAWMLWSHKMLRFLLPWFVILLIGTSLILLMTGQLLYPLVLIAIGSIIMLTWLSGRIRISSLSLLRSFMQMNQACFFAWIKVFRKETIVVWDKAQNG